MIQIFDNFINDDEMCNKIFRYLLQVSPHYFKEVSDESDTYDISTCFYSSDYTLDDDVISFLYHKIFCDVDLDIEKYYPMRINSNIQFLGMGSNSKYHKDGTDFTAVWMCSPNIEGGEFLYLNSDDECVSIDYVRDRLIIFGGNIPHKANPPTNLSARISLAFKLRLR